MAKNQKMDIVKKKVEGRDCPAFRVSFPHVFKPSDPKPGFESKYSITMLFPKTTDLKELKRAAMNAVIEEYGPDRNSWPKKFRWPFRDGDTDRPDSKGYAGSIFVTATSKQRPQVVDGRNKNAAIIEEDGTFYAGCWAKASLIAFTYDKAGNKGVSFSLQNIQKVKDDEKFSGRRDAHEEFDSIDDGSDDASNFESGDDDNPFGP
jgi:hypothetical protein